MIDHHKAMEIVRWVAEGEYLRPYDRHGPWVCHYCTVCESVDGVRHARGCPFIGARQLLGMEVPK